VEQQIPKTSNGKHNSRGVRQAGFLVLKETAMPSVLVESGYLSHEKDEAFLKTKEGQKDVAFAIFKAFSIYKNVIEGKDEGEITLAALEEKAQPIKEKANPKSTSDNESKVKSENRINVKPALEKKIVIAPNSKIKGKDNVQGLSFMVQLAATPKPLDLTRAKYAKLADSIVTKNEGGLIKYLLPVGSTHAEASKALARLKQTDHPGAFISVYQGGKRIKLLYK